MKNIHSCLFSYCKCHDNPNWHGEKWVMKKKKRVKLKLIPFSHVLSVLSALCLLVVSIELTTFIWRRICLQDLRERSKKMWGPCKGENLYIFIGLSWTKKTSTNWLSRTKTERFAVLLQNVYRELLSLNFTTMVQHLEIWNKHRRYLR